MSALSNTISQIEQDWLNPIYKHVDSLFSGTNLPSHDADHHLRVWIHCRQLLLELESSGIEIPTDTVRQCLIACFFHDTGLLKDIGENHGTESKLLCKLFLTENPQIAVENTTNMLDAIEKHDDKREKNLEASSIEDIITTHRLVTTADDMDAFGYIGVFRYTEIYLKRGIPAAQIPHKVVANLKGRFNNFWQSYSLLQKLAAQQKLRYNQTLSFFTNLDASDEEHMMVFNILTEQIEQKNSELNSIISQALSKSGTPFVVTFMNSLKIENSVVIPLKKIIN